MSNRENWADPSVMDIYDNGREITGGLIDKQFEELVGDYVSPGDTVLEIGAGGGALHRMVGDSLPDTVTWIETDQTMAFLQVDRKHETPKALVELPHIPVADRSIDTMFGLSMLDTLSPTQQADTFTEIERILKPGGHFVHFLDLAPNTDYLFERERQNGRSVYVFANDQEGVGAYLVNKDNLNRKLTKGRLDPSIRNVLREYEADPIATTEFCIKNFPQVIDMLAMEVKKLGVVEETIEDLWVYFAESVEAQAAKTPGLKLADVQTHIKSGVVSRLNFSRPVMPGVTQIRRHKGRQLLDATINGLVLPGSVKVESTVMVHDFEKVA